MIFSKIFHDFPKPPGPLGYARYPFKLRNAGCIPAEGGCYLPVGPCTCINLRLGWRRRHFSLGKSSKSMEKLRENHGSTWKTQGK
jgi:hypothetical protein